MTSSFQLGISSFIPGGKWEIHDPTWTFYSGRPMWIRDSLSNAIYLNQPTGNLRFKLLFLTGILAGIAGNAVSLTINATYRILKVASLSHFWMNISWINESLSQSNPPYHLKTRCIEFAKDIARIVLTPLAYIGLLFSSLAGGLNPMENGPRDGAKIFSSIEIAMYGGPIKKGHFGWAPCYQPKPTFHGLGGNIRNELAY